MAAVRGFYWGGAMEAKHLAQCPWISEICDFHRVF